MSAWIEITDTHTGQRKLVFDETFYSDAEYEGANLFAWREGNMSCDCNRGERFDGQDHECNNTTRNRYAARTAYVHDGRVVKID